MRTQLTLLRQAGRRVPVILVTVILVGTIWGTGPRMEAAGAEPEKTPKARVEELLKSQKSEDILAGLAVIVCEEQFEMRKQVAQLAGESADKEVRRQAALALVRFDDMDLSGDKKKELDEARKTLPTRLGSEDIRDHWSAIDDIKRYRLREYSDKLADMAENDKDAETRLQAQMTLKTLSEEVIAPWKYTLVSNMENRAAQVEMQRLYEEIAAHARANEKEIMKKLATGTVEEKKAALFEVETGHLAGCLPLVREMLLQAKQKDNLTFETYRLLNDWKGSKNDIDANYACMKQAMMTEDCAARLWCAVKVAKKEKDPAAVDILVEALRSERGTTRDVARDALEGISGNRFGSEGFDTSQVVTDAIAAKWEAWWKENRGKLR